MLVSQRRRDLCTQPTSRGESMLLAQNQNYVSFKLSSYIYALDCLGYPDWWEGGARRSLATNGMANKSPQHIIGTGSPDIWAGRN